MINIKVCYDEGDCVKGKRVVIIFQKLKNTRIIAGSSGHRATAATFTGDNDNPVICTIEDTYHKVK